MSYQIIKKIRNHFSEIGVDGYVIPKNDQFFSEYSEQDKLKIVSNFTGSAGYAVILKKKNYLFVDGRYTIQAEKEAGNFFKITRFDKIINCDLFKGLTLGINPELFTSEQIKKFFSKNSKVKIIKDSIDIIFKNHKSQSKPFFSLDQKIAGESHIKKIKKITNWMKKKKMNYLFVTAPENVAWLLNIRGHDNPYSPIPNCRLLINDKKKVYLISETNKAQNLIKEKKIRKNYVINPKTLNKLIDKLPSGKIVIDKKSCSIHFENLLKLKFKIALREDPIYFLKSIKNKKEIKGMINSHILDGVALTKFLHWIKKVNKKKITEFDAQKKLESFRKKNKSYLSPSFYTIAGTAENGAIVHYRADKRTAKKINKKDIFLCDSGGQYKYGTTDVTRTICFDNQKNYIKDIFTKVLKGHIAVVTSDLNKHYNGKLIDIRARKFLQKSNLDYQHGTGHGVGFYLNVHEGPQSISKFNSIKMSEGMIVSNEPGFYKKGKFGIRIENLLYVKKFKHKLYFENLTLAPIEKELINFKLLNNDEKNYLFRYHLNIYSKLSKFLNTNEKKWLASYI